MSFDRSKLLVILGSTSTGKTDLAIKLAKKFNGELVACDSRQVYVGLDIGTGKLPSGRWKVENGRWKKGKGFWRLDGVKIWMYDVADLKKQYTVYDYVKEANKVIDGIIERGKLPIIVGGTGLYLKALLDGLSNLAIPADLKLRRKLLKLSVEDLQKKLQEISLQKWEKINNSDRYNPRRLIRAIEILSMSSSRNCHSRACRNPINCSCLMDPCLRRDDKEGFNILKIGLTAPREILYKKINKQVVEWIKNGIVDEVKMLIRQGVTKKRFRQLGLEYGVVIEYLERKISFDQMIEKMQSKVRQYAKRQITWFKKERNICWFDITEENWDQKMEKLILKWYYNS